VSTTTPHLSAQAQNALPTHIAIIMDGNGRWAKERHLPRVEGHRNGVESVRATSGPAAKSASNTSPFTPSLSKIGTAPKTKSTR